MARVIINLTASARKGAVIEISALIAHVMETGYRSDAEGRTVPRDIIRSFACRYNGETVFTAELYPAIAANPFLSFHTVATENGTLEFEWKGDNGFSQVERRELQVT
jgi:sulfur-oxidizing protein SoxZ